jgi:hypothetical protein
LQALIAHFDYYLAHRKASQQNFEAVAEQIVDSATLVDAVTGQSVEPDLNGVIRQLKDGVAESDVTLAPVVQLGIDATNYEGESGVLIFVDQSTVLGWIPISKLPEVIVAEVPTPTTETSPTAYFFAGADIPTIDCPETWIGDAEPVITLDYDLVFDEQRATIDIASYTLRELELPEGE